VYTGRAYAWLSTFLINEKAVVGAIDNDNGCLDYALLSVASGCDAHTSVTRLWALPSASFE
jgi:hypothetical protein